MPFTKDEIDSLLSRLPQRIDLQKVTATSAKIESIRAELLRQRQTAASSDVKPNQDPTL